MSKNQKKKKRIVIIVVSIVVILIMVTLMLVFNREEDFNIQQEATSESKTDTAEFSGGTNLQQVSIGLSMQMEITDIGAYTGIYMEDGTDEMVSGTLMMIVTNTSEKVIQYAEIDMTVGEETAHFTLSTLPAGESVVLLEKSRMEYSFEINYADCKVEAKNIATIDGPLDMHEDKLKIQTLDGVMNVTNISGEDISKDIIIYYKNSAADLYYGGITYRIILQGGLKADEIRQLVANHFNEGGSAIMFVSFGA